MLTAILVALGCVCAGFLAFFAWSLRREGERRPARISFVLATVVAVFFFGATLLPSSVQLLILGALAGTFACGVVLFLMPIGQVQSDAGIPDDRCDERDIMFARARLEPGTRNYRDYYDRRPEHRASDDRTRSLPGLRSLNASRAEPLIFAATEASFDLTGALRDAVDGPVCRNCNEAEPDAMTAFIKGMARYWGARSVGVTPLQPYHVYSHIGRGSGEYGASIDLQHRFAIAFTVEMEREMVDTGPGAPTVLESAQQYVRAAEIAVQLGNLCRNLGYSSRAHIDGNYRVIAPLVARDAGLGGIGRMGLLMTPFLGPRVRVGVVTTDLPLIPDQMSDETAVLDFCRICTKCAENCPVRAIATGDRAEYGGAIRWRINADLCFRYWCVTGTDCGRCLAVCPFSYPNNLTHKIVRWGVQRSGAARRAAFWMDRWFYGPQPPEKPFPGWLARPDGDRGAAGTTETGMR